MACIRHAVPCSLAVPIAGRDASVGTSPSKSEDAKGGPADEMMHPGKIQDCHSIRRSLHRLTKTSESTTRSVSINKSARRFQGQLSSTPMQMDVSSGNNPQETGDWFSSVELMVHYNTTAYRTFCYMPEASERLRSFVPTLALSNKFLMHELLAFSAFHLAYTRPDRRQTYLHQAIWHQDKAITGLREALMEPLNPSNCKAIYSTSILMIVCAFASLPSGAISCTSRAIDSMMDIFPLANGLGTVLSLTDGDNSLGTVRGLFSGSDDNISSRSCLYCLHELIGQVSRLREQLDIIWAIYGREYYDQDVRDTLELSLGSFHDCIRAVTCSQAISAPAELSSVFLWAIRAPPGFLDLVRQGQPCALAIFAHYGVLLHCASPGSWYLLGWGEVLVDCVQERLRGSMWSKLVEWPSSFIRKDLQESLRQLS